MPDDLVTFLRTKAGLAMTRGQAFGQSGHGFMRLNIATQRTKLERALNSLEKALVSMEGAN